MHVTIDVSIIQIVLAVYSFIYLAIVLYGISSKFRYPIYMIKYGMLSDKLKNIVVVICMLGCILLLYITIAVLLILLLL